MKLYSKEMIEINILEHIDCNPKIKGNKYLYNGKTVPRVTEILSDMLHEDFLMKWSNSLGYKHKSYTKELERASSIGSYTHDSIEKYIKNGDFDINEIPSDIRYIINNTLDSFKVWFDNIKNKVKIIGQEQELICPYFGGTYDLLMQVDGRIWLVDFKTSNHISYKYFMQLAAYRYMLSTLMGINIDGCIVLQLAKDDIFFKEYILDFSIKEHNDYSNSCLQAFFGLVYGYYNRQYVSQQYSNIFQ